MVLAFFSVPTGRAVLLKKQSFAVLLAVPCLNCWKKREAPQLQGEHIMLTDVLTKASAGL